MKKKKEEALDVESGNKKIKLPSGAMLEIQLAPFADGQKLLEVFMRVAKDPAVSMNMDAGFDIVKNVMSVAISNEELRDSIVKCMERCTYNNLRFDEDTFEPVKAREDYITVLLEVAELNLRPFTKSLLPMFAALLGVVKQATKMVKDPA